MSFSKTVADAVLLACGRHCALCHKFCGLKIELHHIEQQKDGGPNTAANCIPLCFDCHADMRSYDHKHPKGRKYTPDELRGHRDEWFARYSRTGGATASPEHRELDIATFDRIRTRLPYSGVMRWLQNRYVGQPYRRGQLDPLFDFQEDCKDPSFEFLDADLEAARSVLAEALDAYVEDMLTHTFPDDRPESELNLFSPGAKLRDPDWYYKMVYDVAGKEQALLVAYAELIKLARRKLGVATG